MKTGKYIFILMATALPCFGFFNNANQPLDLLQSGYGGTAYFGDGKSQILAGTTDPNTGAFVAQGVAPEDYFPNVVTLDTNSFSVIGGVVYSKGLLNGGTFPALNTNLAGIFAHFSFATNSRVIIAGVPSFKSASLVGAFSSQGGMMPPTYPSLQISTDGGATWQTGSPQTVPTLVSLYDASGNVDGFTNLIVNSFINPSVIGGTNDLTSQTVLVTTTADGRSAVNVGSANSIAANAVTLWAASPAVADVNLAGHGLVMNSVWENLTSGYNLIFRANGSDFATFTPAVVSGTAPSFVKLTKSGALLTFQLTAVDVPNIQYKTNLTVTGWTDLPSQTNSFASGFWFVTAPAITNAANCFFRAGIAGTNSVSAKVSVAAQFFAASLILTNASGARFAVSVNSTTNGLTFTPAP